MSRRVSLVVALSGCALAGWATPASAVVLLYDPFNQAAGGINGTASSGGGAVWAGAGTWSGAGNISAGSLSYGPLVTNGNQANYDTNASAVRASTTSFGGASTDVWTSFLINANGNSTGLSQFTGGAEQNFMGHGGGSGQTLGLQNPNISTTVAQNTGTHFYVLRQQTGAAGNISTTLWIDPAASSLGTGAAPTGAVFTNQAAPNTDRAPYAWDTLRLGSFASAGVVRFDEFRVGTTWADVSPIPEPTAAATLLLGAGGLLARRRRPTA